VLGPAGSLAWAGLAGSSPAPIWAELGPAHKNKKQKKKTEKK